MYVVVKCHRGVCVCVSQLDEEIMLDGLVSIIQSDAKW